MECETLGTRRLLDVNRQLLLKNELSLLVLLRSNVRSIILPAERGLALDAADIPYCMQTRSHVSILRLSQSNVGDRIKEVGSTMLTVESAADEVLDDREVRLALFAAKDALAAKVLFVCHAHLESILSASRYRCPFWQVCLLSASWCVRVGTSSASTLGADELVEMIQFALELELFHGLQVKRTDG